jgi:hypothetical protein
MTAGTKPADIGSVQPRRSSPLVGFGKILDFLDALAQVVEHGVAPLEQCVTIACRLDAQWRAIEQPDL